MRVEHKEKTRVGRIRVSLEKGRVERAVGPREMFGKFSGEVSSEVELERRNESPRKGVYKVRPLITERWGPRKPGC